MPSIAPRDGRRSALSRRLGDHAPAGAERRPASSGPRPIAARACPDQPLTVENIRGRLDSLDQEPRLNEEQRKDVRTQLQNAVDSLEQAATWRSRQEQIESERSGASSSVVEIRDRLARQPAEPAPEAPPAASVEEVNERLAEAEQDLASAESMRTMLEDAKRERAQNRWETPRRLVELRARLSAIDRQLGAPPPPGEPPLRFQARRTALRAEREAAEAEIAARQIELDSLDGLADLWGAQREAAAAEVTSSRRRVDRLRAARLDARRREAEEASLEARRIIEATDPAIRRVAEENQRIAAMRSAPDGIAAKLEKASIGAERIRAQRASIEADLRDMKAKVELLGTTEALGLLLQQRVSELPPAADSRARIRDRRTATRSVALELYDFSTQRDSLAEDLDGAASRAIEGSGVQVPAQRLEAVRAEARGLLQTRSRLLDALIRDLNVYFNSLIDLDTSEQQLISTIEEYRSYVEERVLWVPVAGPLRFEALLDAWTAVRWLLAPATWGAAIPAMARFAIGNKLASFTVVLLVAILLGIGPLAASRMRVWSADFHRSPSSRSAALALLWAHVHAVRWPVACWGAGWLLSSSADSSSLAAALGAGLRGIANALFLIQLLRWLCAPGGVGERILDWSVRAVVTVRRTMAMTARFLVPLLLLTIMLYAHYRATKHTWAETTGRITWLAAMAFLAAAGWRLTRPNGGLLDSFVSRHPGWLRRLPWISSFAVLAIPLSFASMSIAGYTHTSFQLTRAVFYSVWLVAGAIVLVQVAGRLLEPNRAPPEAEAAEAAEQALRLVQWGAIAAVLLGLWRLWADLLPAVGFLRTIDLWTVETAQGVATVTVASLLLAFLIAAITLVVSHNLRGLLHSIVPASLKLDAGAGYAFATIARYAVMGVGFIAAFGSIGIGWSRVQWLVAGLSVGLGFGLQDIFANLVSGIIILFERPIRVGDIVTIGGVDGEVTRIRVRATTILDFDRRELIVPNRDLVTGRLINWTLSDPVCRLGFSVSVPYGTDPATVEQILLQAARDDSKVLDHPPPTAALEQFADNTLIFRLSVFVPRRQFADVVRELNPAIVKGLQDAGIRMAFPQRDVQLNMVRPLDVRVVDTERPSSDAAGESGGARVGRE